MQAQRESGVKFYLENPSHRVDGLWVVSLEAPTTEMISLQVFVGQHRNYIILASKSSEADQCRAPRETAEKIESKIGVDFGPEGGVDLAWIFWGREKRAEKIGAIS